MKPFLLSAILLFNLTVTGQEEMRLVDFHIHTSLKNYFRHVNHPKQTISRAFRDSIKEKNWNANGGDENIKDFVGFNSVCGKASYDQATYPLLTTGNASILCTSVYSLEKQSLSRKTLPVTEIIKIRRLPILPSVFDNLITMRFINKAAVTKIGKKRQKVAFDPSNTNFDEFEAQLRFMEAQLPVSGNNKPVSLATYGSNLEDKSRIWLVLTAEGAHNFYGPSTSKLEDVMYHDCTPQQEKEILENLNKIKDGYRLFFITPAHLFENKVAGGARGLDMDKNFFRFLLARLMWTPKFAVIDNKDIEGINSYFYKNLKGRPQCDCLREAIPTDTVTVGWRFISNALEKNKHGKRTLIDMRHMDVKSRIQYIEYIREYNSQNPADKIPIIVSHAAVSGKSQKMAEYLGSCPLFDNYKEFTPKHIRKFYIDQIQKYGCGSKMGLVGGSPFIQVDNHLREAGWFHPMSNNLFDEEIQAVYETEGVIGITMEERALGKATYNYEINKATKGSLKKYFKQNAQTFFSQEQLTNGELLQKLEIVEPFVRNLFYIIEKSNVTNVDNYGFPKRWKGVVIGSDFDGIINPIDECPTVANTPEFYKFLCQTLTFYAAYMNKQGLLDGKHPKDLMDRLFFLNGEEFIKKHF